MSRKEDFFMAPSLSAGSLSGGVELSPDATYRSLQTKYMDFSLPQASVCFGLNNTTLKSIAADMVVNDISIELTCGFEASIARFRIYNVYDSSTGQFRYSALKKHLYMGNSLSISMGYAGKLETVFVGFVAGVSFGYQRGDLPYIEVSGMDAKGIMMAGGYACQLTADNYADAVSEILRRTAYEELKRSGAIRDIKVTATPDVDPSLLTAMQAQEAAQAAVVGGGLGSPEGSRGQRFCRGPGKGGRTGSGGPGRPKRGGSRPEHLQPGKAGSGGYKGRRRGGDLGHSRGLCRRHACHGAGALGAGERLHHGNGGGKRL